MVRLESVTVAYDAFAAVDDVSLTVRAGEWLGVIGPNGAGKSSLVRAVAHLQRYRGRITVDGVPIRPLGHRQRARLVAYVPQQPQVPGGMTVMQYTLLGRTPHIGYLATETDDDARRCLAVLHRLGIADLADRVLPTLSGGEMQRAVLARALAQEAPLLLLDEPTSALDLGNRVDALELVDELRHERGLTVVSVMHDLTLAAQFSDRLALLHHGRLLAVGPPADVIDERVLSTSFGRRVRVITDPSGTLVVAPMRGSAGHRDSVVDRVAGQRRTLSTLEP